MLNNYDIGDITHLFYKRLNKEIDKEALSDEIKILFVNKEEPKRIIERFFNEFSTSDSFYVTSFTMILDKLKDKNLIKPNKFYYHPVLQLSNNRIKLRQNEDGYFEEVKEDFFYIRNLKYYDLNDVLDYYYKKFNPIIKYNKRDISILKTLYELSSTDLDLILYTIDAAHKDVDKEILFQDSPVSLFSYTGDGRTLYEERTNLCKQYMIDKEMCIVI